MRRLAALLLVALLCVPAFAPPIAADEEGEPKALVTRIFEVGALTGGIPGFLRPGAPMDVYTETDEEHPLFGGEWEEPLYPVGQVDELIEFVKVNVDPVTWERTEGADIMSMGEHRLLVRAPRSTVDTAAAFLATVERDMLTPVAIELAVIPVDAGKDAAGTLSAADLDVANSIAGVSVSALPRQHTVAWDGSQYSFIRDYDVEVASGAQTSRPLVRIANLGLLAKLSARPAPDGSATRLMVDAVHSELADAPERDVGEGRVVRAPVYRTVKCNIDTMVTPGEWTVLDTGTLGAQHVAFAARVTPRKLALRPAAPDHAFLQPDPFDDSGRMALRMYDVTRLTAAARDICGCAPWFLMPSSYTPPEPPELREPEPIFPPDYLPDLIMSGMGMGSAFEMGTIEIRNGILIVRNTPSVLDAIDTLLGKLRKGSLRTVTVRAELIEVDAATAARLAAAGPFDAAARKTLLGDLAPNTIFSGRVTSARDSRRTLTAGDAFSYVQGFHVEIAEKAAISNPILMRAYDGTELDVHPVLNSTESAVSMQVRFVHTNRTDDNRKAATPHGELEMPQLATMRMQHSVMAPLGKTVAACAGGKGATRKILLLTPTLKREGK